MNEHRDVLMPTGKIEDDYDAKMITDHICPADLLKNETSEE